MLQELLNLISKPDTGILIAPFNITTQELAHTIDTITLGLKLDQRKQVIDSLQDKAIVYNALYKAMHPFMMDDANYYGILITTKKGIKIKAEANSFAALYDLPCVINNVKCYNPNISLIYSYICDNKLYPAQERKWLLYRVDKNIFQDHFMTRFNWEDLKNDNPRSYTIIKDTFYPVKFRMYKGASYVYFRSKKLPHYVQISTSFYNTDTLEFKRLKIYEDTLTKIFAHSNFLLRYMDTRADAQMILSPVSQVFMKRYYHSIKKYYAQADS
ncbi:hypothetical protein [Mucilaginibacter sp.]